MIQIYPSELMKGDLLLIDMDGQTIKEEVDSISPAGPESEKTLVFTVSRMIVCENDIKVSIERFVEQSVGE